LSSIEFDSLPARDDIEIFCSELGLTSEVASGIATAYQQQNIFSFEAKRFIAEHFLDVFESYGSRATFEILGFRSDVSERLEALAQEQATSEASSHIRVRDRVAVLLDAIECVPTMAYSNKSMSEPLGQWIASENKSRGWSYWRRTVSRIDQVSPFGSSSSSPSVADSGGPQRLPDDQCVRLFHGLHSSRFGEFSKEGIWEHLSSRRTDFGNGLAFYTTNSEVLAAEWARRMADRSNGSMPVVLEFQIPLNTEEKQPDGIPLSFQEVLDDFGVRDFGEQPTLSWAQFICHCRRFKNTLIQRADDREMNTMVAVNGWIQGPLCLGIQDSGPRPFTVTKPEQLIAHHDGIDEFPVQVAVRYESLTEMFEKYLFSVTTVNSQIQSQSAASPQPKESLECKERKESKAPAKPSGSSFTTRDGEEVVLSPHPLSHPSALTEHKSEGGWIAPVPHVRQPQPSDGE